MRFLYIMAIALIAAGCGSNSEIASNSAAPGKDARVEKLERVRDSLKPFFEPMEVRDGDWLDTQKEFGETFEEYVRSNPTLPTPKRRKIYIQPIGTFSHEQRNAIKLAAEYMKAFYDLPVELNADRPLGSVPRDKMRKIEYKNNLQIRTAYFLEDVLPKLLEDDAAALIALTNYDLYPGDTWAFVFGQATFKDRVGVWSLYRLADPITRKYDPKLLLTRTIKVATHEVGHMFSMKHCTKYECLMAGTNHVLETDRRPIDNCPECTAKLSWAMNYEPLKRYERLAEFWKKQGWLDEEKLMRDKANAIRGIK